MKKAPKIIRKGYADGAEIVNQGGVPKKQIVPTVAKSNADAEAILGQKQHQPKLVKGQYVPAFDVSKSVPSDVQEANRYYMSVITPARQVLDSALANYQIKNPNATHLPAIIANQVLPNGAYDNFLDTFKSQQEHYRPITDWGGVPVDIKKGVTTTDYNPNSGGGIKYGNTTDYGPEFQNKPAIKAPVLAPQKKANGGPIKAPKIRKGYADAGEIKDVNAPYGRDKNGNPLTLEQANALKTSQDNRNKDGQIGQATYAAALAGENTSKSSSQNKSYYAGEDATMGIVSQLGPVGGVVAGITGATNDVLRPMRDTNEKQAGGPGYSNTETITGSLLDPAAALSARSKYEGGYTDISGKGYENYLMGENKKKQIANQQTATPLLQLAKGGPVNFKNKEDYAKWLAYGHIHGAFDKTPGNQKVSIAGKSHKVEHKANGGGVSVAKAKEIMRDGTANGIALTDKQKSYFGWIIGGSKGKAEGGTIEGAGTGKSDSIKADLNKKDFIIPVESANSKIVKAMMEKLGLNKVAPLKKGNVPVKVSDGEKIVPFSKRAEAEKILITLGYKKGLTGLAPNADDSEEKEFGGNIMANQDKFPGYKKGTTKAGVKKSDMEELPIVQSTIPETSNDPAALPTDNIELSKPYVAPVPKKSNIDWAQLLGVGQTVAGAGVLLKDGKRPVDTLSPEYNNMVNRGQTDATYGFDPATKSAYTHDIEAARINNVGLAAQTAGGDASVANANARVATNDYAKQMLGLASEDTRTKIAKQRYADALIADKAEKQRRLFEDKLNAFNINQQAGAGMLGAGIESIQNNERNKRYEEMLAGLNK